MADSVVKPQYSTSKADPLRQQNATYHCQRVYRSRLCLGQHCWQRHDSPVCPQKSKSSRLMTQPAQRMPQERTERGLSAAIASVLAHGHHQPTKHVFKARSWLFCIASTPCGRDLREGGTNFLRFFVSYRIITIITYHIITGEKHGTRSNNHL